MSDELSATALGELADEFWQVKAERLAADKVAKELKTREEALNAKLIEQMLRQKISAVGGASIVLIMNTPTYEPAVKDWPKFWEYILETKDFSLLEKRPGRAAIKERWGLEQSVPGVEKFPVYKLSKSGVK